MTHYVLILAGGQGSRLNKTKIPKQFLTLNKTPILMHSIRAFKEADPQVKIYIGLQENHKKIWSDLCIQHDFKIEHKIYMAGKERFYTVFSGLESICKDHDPHDGIVSIHDAARPFINKKFILDLLHPFKDSKYKAVIPVLSLKNSIINYDKNDYQIVNRDHYMLCQTPQCFKLKSILKAYNGIIAEFRNQQTQKTNRINHILQNSLHDDLTIFNKFFSTEKASVKFIKGKNYNIKITTDLDYFISEKIQNFVSK